MGRERTLICSLNTNPTVVKMIDQWSEWLPLRTEDFKTIPNLSGTYEIRWSIKGKPQSINRVNAVDKSGLLYIGKAKNLRSRIRAFWRDIRSEKLLDPREYAHTAAYTYMCYGYEKKFRPDHLEVRWIAGLATNLMDEISVDQYEIYLMTEYILKYLDRPPLNVSARRFNENQLAMAKWAGSCGR